MIAALLALGAQVFEGHADAVKSVRFSPDYRRVLTASRDTTAVLWDAATGKRLRTFEGSTGGLAAADFSPDGTLVATGGQDKTIVLWDAATGKRLKSLEGHRGWIRDLAFTPDGKRLLSASQDRTIATWDLERGERAGSFQAHPARILSCGWSPDRTRVLVGSDDNTLALWSVARGEAEVSFAGFQGWARFSALRPDGKVAMTGSWDNSFWAWDTATGGALVRRMEHGAWVVSGAFREDGGLFAAGDRDGGVRLWSGDARSPREVTRRPQSGSVHALALSPTGRVVIAGHESGEVAVWRPFRSDGDDRWAGEWRKKEEGERRREVEALAADYVGEHLGNHLIALERLVRAGAEAASAVVAAAPPEKGRAAPEEARLGAILKDLDHDDFETRVAARKSLLAFGPPALPWIAKQLERGDPLSAEVRGTLTEVRAQIGEEQSAGADLPRLRAVLFLAELDRGAAAEALKAYAAQAAALPSRELAKRLLDAR